MAEIDYRNTVFDLCKFQPTAAQAPIYDALDLFRVVQVCGADRSGKSKTGAMCATLSAPRTDLVWIVANEYDLTRKEFEYCVENFDKMKILDSCSFPSQGPSTMTITPNKCVIKTKSALDFQRLVMEAPGMILICEGAIMEYEAYQRLVVRSAEKRAKIVMTGSFEGSVGWWVDFHNEHKHPKEGDDIVSFALPAVSNTYVFKGYDDPEIKRMEKELTPERFAERVLARPMRPIGMVVSEFDTGTHVGDYPFDKNIPVEIAIDPGYGAPGAYAVLAIQVKNGRVYLIDEIYKQRVTSEEMIKSLVRKKAWFNNCHQGVIDIAARQHHASKSPIEYWRELCPQIELRSRKVNINDGVDLLRTWMRINPEKHEPDIYINHSVKGFISECGGSKPVVSGGGAWMRNEATGEPLDTNCHSAKALIYWLAVRYGLHDRTQSKLVLVSEFWH
jgi:hypothetical protein